MKAYFILGGVILSLPPLSAAPRRAANSSRQSIAKKFTAPKKSVNKPVFSLPTKELAPLTRQMIPSWQPWPQAPNGGKPITYKASRDYSSVFKIEDRAEGPAPDNPVKMGEAPTGLKGILLSTSAGGTKYPVGLRSYLSMRLVGFPNVPASAVNYHHQLGDNSDTIGHISLSPDGNRLYYGGISNEGRYGGYGYYVWNLKEGKAYTAQGDWDGARVAFSPTGALRGYLSVPREGDTLTERLQTPWTGRGDGYIEMRDMTKPFEPYLLPTGDQPAPTSPQYPYWRITNNAVPRRLTWTRDSRLLYAALEGGNTKYPSVWLADPRTRKTRKVIERAYDPVPSPDGKWIAFFGWPLDEKPINGKPSTPSHWLYNIQNGKTYLVDDQNAGFVLWTPDSQKLVEVRFDNDFQSQIRMLPLTTALGGAQAITALPNSGTIATLTVKDPLSIGPRGWPQPIEVQTVSKNGKYLILDLSEYVGQPTNGFNFVEDRTLKVVNLENGQLSDLATAQRSGGSFSWYWFDLSDAPAGAWPKK